MLDAVIDASSQMQNLREVRGGPGNGLVEGMGRVHSVGCFVYKGGGS